MSLNGLRLEKKKFLLADGMHDVDEKKLFHVPSAESLFQKALCRAHLLVCFNLVFELRKYYSIIRFKIKA